MNDCLFCKIIRREIPSTIVYEDADTFAFLDIHPVNPGHVLVVPKVHAIGLLEATPGVAGALMVAVQKIARAVKVGMGVEGFNLEQNDGAVAGQVIPHLHVHIIPRRTDDGLKHWPGNAYAEGEATRVAQAIMDGLSK
jgi:histidine triad (HIT) family protein